jgi:hypothetical protein
LTSAAATAPSLADSFDLLAPSLPAALVAPALLPELRTMASTLAALPRAGLEVRLGPSPHVDLQQWFTTREREPQRLLDHVRRAGWSGPVARRLDGFLTRWSDASKELHDTVTELWLEFDYAAAPGARPLSPLSLFLGMAPDADALQTTFAALDALLGEGQAAPWRTQLAKCIEGCPDGARVSHIGLMLGRDTPSLRANVKNLSGEALPVYLREIGWPGALGDAVDLFATFRPLVDRVALCLDVGVGIKPELGFECSLDGQPPANPRWATLMRALVDRGWCSPAKSEALLEWPGLTTPANAAAPWPAELIRSELLRGSDQLTAFERQLSHVKLTLGRGPQPEAKAYFGYFHTWLRPPHDHDEAAPSQPPSRPRVSVRAGRSTPVSTDATIDGALGFLLAARTPKGWWLDFSGVLENNRRWRAGASDEWVSAYVGGALAGIDSDIARRAARRTWGLLVARRPPGAGWGFNRSSAPDADSTAWALRLAAAIREHRSPHAQLARAALNDYVRADGGLATYCDDSLAGWSRTSHACVTAAAAGVTTHPVLEFLRRAQAGDGSWSAYWWEDPEYPTALAAEALAASGALADRARVASAVAWATRRIGPDGSAANSPFATAWCVGLLGLTDDDASTSSRRRAVEWLVDRQREDGSWLASARLVVPPPHVSQPAAAAECTKTHDDARIFTTATVLAALTGGGTCRV